MQIISRIDLKHSDVRFCVTEVFPEHCAYDVSAAELQIVGYDYFSSEITHHSRSVCIYIKSKHKRLIDLI